MLVVDSDRVESPGATPTLVGMAKRFLTRRVGGGQIPGSCKVCGGGVPNTRRVCADLGHEGE